MVIPTRPIALTGLRQSKVILVSVGWNLRGVRHLGGFFLRVTAVSYILSTETFEVLDRSEVFLCGNRFTCLPIWPR